MRIRFRFSVSLSLRSRLFSLSLSRAVGQRAGNVLSYHIGSLQALRSSLQNGTSRAPTTASNPGILKQYFRSAWTTATCDGTQ